MWSMRYASKYSAIFPRRCVHHRQPSAIISFQLYVGKPQFWPLAEKASGGAPACPSMLK